MTIEEIRAYIARKKNQEALLNYMINKVKDLGIIADLERLYGTGVGSAAIREEIAILSFYIRDAEDQLNAMEPNNEIK